MANWAMIQRKNTIPSIFGKPPAGSRSKSRLNNDQGNPIVKKCNETNDFTLEEKKRSIDRKPHVRKEEKREPLSVHR